MDNNIVVSIICNTYNHKEFIGRALEGFIMQKTNFKFEVLVHDDASTDGTAEVIREYEKKYPDIIKPIYQTENQFSKRTGIMKNFQYPRVKGKYIAHCEGDDSWIDENKLQKQIDFMENHPNCVMTCHNSKRVNYKTGEEKIENPIETEGYATAEDILVDKPGYWIATASLVYKKEIGENIPEFFSLPPVGDMPLRWYCFAMGDVFYFKDVMSIYNYSVPGSWSAGGAYKKQKGDYIEFYKLYNEFTEFKYDKYIREESRKRTFVELCKSYDLKTMRSEEYRDLYDKLPLKDRVYIQIYYQCPQLAKAYSRLKRIRGKRNG